MVENSINPMSGFLILKYSELSDVETKNLIDLYQPLVGPVAIGLYLLLWNESHKKYIVSQRPSHSQLLSLLDCDARVFYQVRIKLEALGLLKTYENEDQLGEYYIYELHNPLSPRDFFNENLLSVLLLEKIGQAAFEELSKKYKVQNNILSDSRDITKSFLDVFKLSNQDILETPDIIQETQKEIIVQKNNTPSIKSNNNLIDWSFLGQLTSQYGITSKELEKNEEELYELHVFYGLDELELSMLIAKSINLSDHSIDIKKLNRFAQKKYENRINITEKVITEKTNKNQSSNPLINKANELIPSEFLAYEKNQKNGFVGTSETRVLRKLQNRHVLPDEVVNMLIHYVLQKSPTLSDGLVETVANDWSQNGVNTAENALKRINDFESGSNNKRRSNKTLKVEQGTDWNKVNPSKEENFDPDTLINEANRRLKKLHEGQSK
ncbi:DnaD domain protein [Companilactobacillus sp. DQM5]|uniref:DnaD domain protein n=1 Tax=Companilactobacillus sp. DQM5 TaxID=3463359 RepID=UPI004059B07B